MQSRVGDIPHAKLCDRMWMDMRYDVVAEWTLVS